MCTNSRFIFNPYSRKNVLVKCGKCPSCLQEKAFARAQRIKNNYSDGTICLFFTLTYSNDYIPYIDRDDVYEDSLCSDISDLNIYRDSSVRLVFDRHSGRSRWKKCEEKSIIGSVPYAMLDLSDIDLCSHIHGKFKSYISICWYPDIQDFFKRLRQNLIRHYYYEKSFSYFSCSEYGSMSQRAHFHGLLFIPREDETVFRSAIVESWPYADQVRTAKFIEVARDCSNYVASYVNSPSRLLSTLSNDFFKQKHSQSKNFGVVLDCFSIVKILEKIDSGDLFYYYNKKYDGESTVRPVPIPLYVLHRYFPICKGFSWLDSCQLRAILLNPQKVGDVFTDVDICLKYIRYVYDYDKYSNSCVHDLTLVHNVPVRRSCKLINPLYHFTPKESYKIYVRLENCYRKFHDETGLSRFDYAFYFERVYSLYSSTLLKCLHEDVTSLEDYSDFYDNGFELLHNPLLSPTLSNLDIQLDPNERRFIVANDLKNKTLFSRMDKQRKVTNYSLSNLGYNV